MGYELQDIRFQYHSQQVLDIESAVFTVNQSYAILGENGSGKSTLLNLLALVNPVQQGVLLYNGSNISTENSHQLRESIAYVQQKPYLFHFSVFENIALPLKIRGIDKTSRTEKTQAIIEKLAITKLSGRNARELSGGEVQKVALARALVTRPSTLILDEPFSHLDMEARQDMERIILQLRERRDCMMIFSLHDQLKAHVLADEVLTLTNGRLMDSNLMNLYSGTINSKDRQFDTGKIRINLPEQIETGSHIAIDARLLVLSSQKLVSSMRNEFHGKVQSLDEHQGQIRVSIDVGEIFQCIITHDALKALNIHPGDAIWVYFKSSSIKTV